MQNTVASRELLVCCFSASFGLWPGLKTIVYQGLFMEMRIEKIVKWCGCWWWWLWCYCCLLQQQQKDTFVDRSKIDRSIFVIFQNGSSVTYDMRHSGVIHDSSGISIKPSLIVGATNAPNSERE